MNQLGLIGFPLAHSFSEKYFKVKFQNENIDNWKYQNFEIPKIEILLTLVSENIDLKGLNVTIPYKEQVLRYLDEIDEEAQEIGAVNTLKISKLNSKLHVKGYNTDYYGFKKSLKPLLESHHKNALILGTGGASKAVAFALKKLNIYYKFVSRIAKDEHVVSYKDITNDALKNYQIIINTTPIGTFPNVTECPDLPYSGLTNSHILFDLVYNPDKTRFLELGEKYGAKTKNGYEMLTLQAEKAWEIFTSA